MTPAQPQPKPIGAQVGSLIALHDEDPMECLGDWTGREIVVTVPAAVDRTAFGAVVLSAGIIATIDANLRTASATAPWVYWSARFPGHSDPRSLTDWRRTRPRAYRKFQEVLKGT